MMMKKAQTIAMKIVKMKIAKIQELIGMVDLMIAKIRR